MALACAGSPAAARAAELAVTPSASLRASYDDNIDLVRGGSSPASGYGATLGAAASVSSEYQSLKLDTQLGATRYPSKPNRNAENGRIAASWEWRGERLSASADASAALETTRQSELAETGVVLDQVQRRAYALGISVNHALSERMTVATSASANQVRYEAGSGLSDYDQQSASLRLSYALSERVSAGVAASASLFETVDGATRTRSNTASAFVSYAWSERLNFALSLGRDSSSTRRRAGALVCELGDPLLCLLLGIPLSFASLEQTTRSSGRSYSLSADYAFDTGQLSLRAGQSLRPSGIGAVLRSENADVGWSQRLGEHLGWGLAASVVQTRAPDDSGGSTRLVRLGTTLSWQLDPDVAADFSLTHSRASVSTDSQVAVSNAVSAGLRYAWPRWSRPF